MGRKYYMFSYLLLVDVVIVIHMCSAHVRQNSKNS